MVEVYKHDGTKQCGMGVETPLEAMRADLERLGAKVLKSEKRRWPASILQKCDLPTGWCNVYQLSEHNWPLQAKVILGAGFGLWPQTPGTEEVQGRNLMEGAEPLENPIPWPFSVLSEAPEDWDGPWPFGVVGLAHAAPNGLGALLGKQLRVYHDGDAYTQDFKVDRVNLVLNRDTAAIIEVWFG